MSEQYFADAIANHSTLKTPFWDSIPDRIKSFIAATFPDNDVPKIASANDEFSSKLEAITDLLKQTVETREKTLQPTDILRFKAMHALAISYTRRSMWVDGQKIYEHLIAEAREALGPDSKPELGAVFNISGVYEELGLYEKAEGSYKKSLVQLEKILGKATPQYLGGIRGLVDILAKQGKFEEADGLLVDGKGIVEKMGGPFKDEEVEAMEECEEKYLAMKK